MRLLPQHCSLSRILLHSEIHANVIRLFSPVPTREREMLALLLNGKECIARTDSGSDKDIISESYIEEHVLEIRRREVDNAVFKMGNGKYLRSARQAKVPPRPIPGDSQ